MALLQPKNSKYRKSFRGKMKGLATRGTSISFGDYGLKAMDSSWITARQIEAVRKVVIRRFKKSGKLWIRIFPDKPITSKGTEFKMGRGKGDFSHYVCPVRAGRIMFEVGGIKEELAREVFKKAAEKLPIKTKFVIKRGLHENQ